VVKLSVFTPPDQKEAVHELKKQLRSGELGASEAAAVQAELEEIASGRAGKRKARLGLSPLVGTTCAASLFKLFKDHTFEVLLLDECSQMVEPLSLLPLHSFRPRKLICVGDPMQLAPPLPSDGPQARDLSLAMFSRLAEQYEPILLATQYRCHPVIAATASRLFYNNVLVSGISPEQRLPLLPAVPPLLFLDSAGMGTAARDAGGSYANEMHSRLALQLLLTRLAPLWPSADALAARVGLVTLFRAQAHQLRTLFQKHPVLHSVRISTVDAFQGAEMDVIVVVSSGTGGGQFVADVRRLNVTLTRARYHVIFIGDCKTLRAASHEWREIINACQVIGADNFLME
jgi:superfamily I DNA and/or RNA helicase